MIMYFIATGKQPFSDHAHDELLALDICKGIRPEISEPEVPKCYIDLIKKCWDSNPDNRPNAIEVKKSISQFYDSYCLVGKDKEIIKQFEEAKEYRKANLSSIKNNQLTSHHPNAHYTS